MLRAVGLVAGVGESGRSINTLGTVRTLVGLSTMTEVAVSDAGSPMRSVRERVSIALNHVSSPSASQQGVMQTLVN